MASSRKSSQERLRPGAVRPECSLFSEPRCSLRTWRTRLTGTRMKRAWMNLQPLTAPINCLFAGRNKSGRKAALQNLLDLLLRLTRSQILRKVFPQVVGLLGPANFLPLPASSDGLPVKRSASRPRLAAGAIGTRGPISICAPCEQSLLLRAPIAIGARGARAPVVVSRCTPTSSHPHHLPDCLAQALGSLSLPGLQPSPRQPFPYRRLPNCIVVAGLQNHKKQGRLVSGY